MKLRLALLLVLLIGLLAFAGAAAAQDADATLVILQDGDTYSSSFKRDVTAQLYGFNASEGDEVSIEMVPGGNNGLDPFLVLLSNQGEVLAFSDDIVFGEDLNSRIEAEIPADGSYLILASSYTYIENFLEESNDALDAGQEFDISINGITPPENMDGFDPNTVTIFFTEVELGSNEEFETTDEQQVAFLVINAEEGTDVSIDVESNDFFSIIHVFDTAGDRIAVDSNRAEGDPNASVSFSAPATGTYLVMVGDAFFYAFVDDPGSDDDETELYGPTLGEFSISVE
jgi:hypothetical protein